MKSSEIEAKRSKMELKMKKLELAAFCSSRSREHVCDREELAQCTSLSREQCRGRDVQIVRRLGRIGNSHFDPNFSHKSWNEGSFNLSFIILNIHLPSIE